MKAFYFLDVVVLATLPSASYAASPCTYKTATLPHIAASSEATLSAIVTDAQVTSCVITSTARTSEEQAREMFNFIKNHSVAEAHTLYGSAGDKVIDVYEAEKAAGSSDDVIRTKMVAKVKEVLPEAQALKQLMHLDRPAFDVFDISIAQLQPQTAKDRFKTEVNKRVTAGTVHRFLAENNGEKDAYHIEIKKP